MEKEPLLEKEPQEFRVILRENFQQRTDSPLEDTEPTEPDPNYVLWSGTMTEPKGSELWEEAGLITPIEEDKYEIQVRDENDAWLFMGFFSTPDDLQWVFETARGDAELQA